MTPQPKSFDSRQPNVMNWDQMSQEDRLRIAMRAGWRTHKETPTNIAKRLSRTEWADILPLTQQTLKRFAA